MPITPVCRDTLLRRLLEEHVDLFIGDITQLEDHADLQLTWLPRWPSGFFCTPDHPLASRDAVTRDELLGNRLGSIELSPWALSDLCEYFERSIDAAISFRSDDFRDVEAAAVAGRMIVFGNSAAFRDALSRGALVELPLDPPFRREARLGLVTLAARTLSPAATHAKALAEKIFADFSASVKGPAS